MNKTALKKNVGHHVRIRPMAKRFAGGPGGLQLPPVDDPWQVQGSEKDGLRISNTATGHGTVLGFDHIREFMTDPAGGQGDGLFILKSQLNIGGNSLWTEPTFRPGEALPDQFGNVRDWKRENDAAYVQSLFPAPRPALALPPIISSSPGLGLALLAGVCIGVCIGLAIADA